MELADYLTIIRRYAVLVVAIPILFAVVGYIGTLRRPPKYEGSTTLTVEKPQAAPQAASAFYQYDEYYSQLASTLFADTIANWLRSPDPVVEIYATAGLPVPSGGAAEVARTFRVSKGEETTVITLTIQDKDEGNAAKIIEAAKTVINKKVDELRVRNGGDPSYFSIDMTAAQVFTSQDNPVIIAILGAISGLILAFVLVFSFAFLRVGKRS